MKIAFRDSTYRKFPETRLNGLLANQLSPPFSNYAHRSGGARGSWDKMGLVDVLSQHFGLTFLTPAVLISVSRSNHSNTWFPAIPISIQTCPMWIIETVSHKNQGYTRRPRNTTRIWPNQNTIDIFKQPTSSLTLKLQLFSRFPTKNGNLGVVSLVHQGAKHSTCRGAISIAHWYVFNERLHRWNDDGGPGKSTSSSRKVNASAISIGCSGKKR